jgi:Fe-S cluster assembly protein SufD
VTKVLERTNPYLADFERFQKATAATTRPALYRLRKAAVARFTELGFPGPRDEEWRFTSVAALVQVPFELGPVHGVAEDLSITTDRPLPQGVVLCRLAEALAKHPQQVEPYLGQLADYKGHPFTALNTAFLRDGAFLYVPPGQSVEGTITVRYCPAGSSTTPHVWHRRGLIILSANSRATLVEEYTGPARATYFTNAVTEVVVGANAVLDHYKVQEEGASAFHVHALHVRQDRGSNFSSHSVALGGQWVRNEVNAVLGAEGCECTLNGLYQAGGQQLIDNHTAIDHARPHCNSHELYKGILGGQARGVFNGKIYVRQDAQKTDAKQTNQTLLLSDDATINTKPQLEIYADDVKCTHGATVGQLDDEALFYLRTRGLGEAEARALLTFAFANDVISRIQVDALRERLGRQLLAVGGLPGADQAEV